MSQPWDMTGEGGGGRYQGQTCLSETGTGRAGMGRYGLGWVGTNRNGLELAARGGPSHAEPGRSPMTARNGGQVGTGLSGPGRAGWSCDRS